MSLLNRHQITLFSHPKLKPLQEDSFSLCYWAHIFFCSLSFAQIARRGLMRMNSIFLVTLLFFYSQWRKTSSDMMNCALNCPFLSDSYKRSTGQTAQVCESEAGERSLPLCVWTWHGSGSTTWQCGQCVPRESPCTVSVWTCLLWPPAHLQELQQHVHSLHRFLTSLDTWKYYKYSVCIT